MKTKTEYQKDYDATLIEYQKLGKKLTRIRNKMTKMKVNEEEEFVATIPFDDVDEITDEQWSWILYHWKDDTSYAYQVRTKFLYNLGLSPNMMAGHDQCDNVKQFCFSIHNHHTIEIFFEKFNIVKPHLKPFNSEIVDVTTANNPIIDIHLFINVYGWDYEYDDIYLEIDPNKDMGRFVRHHNSVGDNKSDWMSLENCILKLKEYQRNS